MIIPHFYKYPPITQKLADYILFKEIVYMMKNKEHLTLDGLKKVLSIKASLNLGLSDDLNVSFPNIKPVLRPLVLDKDIPHADWVAGFTSGDGSFYLHLRKNEEFKVGYRVEIVYRISQHLRDAQLMEKFTSYFQCGKVKKDARNSVLYFTVSNFQDILEKIIPFFKEYSILGVKSLDFNDWCKAAEIISTKGHVTQEGLDKLLKIQNGMNSSRLY